MMSAIDNIVFEQIATLQWLFFPVQSCNTYNFNQGALNGWNSKK
jgi:hypothetical protein